MGNADLSNLRGHFFKISNHGGSSNVTKYLAPPLFQTCRRPCSVFILLINASNYNLNETTKSTCITNSRNRPSCLQKLGKLQSHQSPLQKKKLGLLVKNYAKTDSKKLWSVQFCLMAFLWVKYFVRNCRPLRWHMQTYKRKTETVSLGLCSLWIE